MAQSQQKNETISSKTNSVEIVEYMNEEEAYRLQSMLAELEREAEDGEERSIADNKLFSNPYKNLELEARYFSLLNHLCRIREIDDKLVEYNYERPQIKDEEFVDVFKVCDYLVLVAKRQIFKGKS